MGERIDTRTTLDVGGTSYETFSLTKLAERYEGIKTLPYSLRILLENLLRHEDGERVTWDDIEALAQWNETDKPSVEIAYTPARVLLQDFTGVPSLVDLAAMRDAMRDLDGDPAQINPIQPADLVIDHSVQVDEFRSKLALEKNIEREYERNGERYAFLRWGQKAFDNFTVVPPGTGICHQVNLEYLGKGVFTSKGTGTDDAMQAYPDTLVGTDSHTTMINGLGVLGWGVGGIEAEAAMLGQPTSMLIPQVVGFELTGKLPEGATATDLVLSVTEILRDTGVVEKFVEFFGSGLANLQLADRATIGNMSPEFGSTCAIFPIDAETLRYMHFSGRSNEHIELVEAYMRAQGLFHDENSPRARYSQKLHLDLGSVEPSIAGPRRPQDRIPLRKAKEMCSSAIDEIAGEGEARAAWERLNQSYLSRWTNEGGNPGTEPNDHGGVMVEEKIELEHGSVAIAAITSCTNTSNPSVMVAAGLVARKARALGMKSKPWVKTSLAPGSKVVTRYLQNAGLDTDLEALGFNTVGYGCTTCIGNSGPLPDDVLEQVEERDLAVASILSGNRNFEGRINSEVKLNFLASPPLVVIYALHGHMAWDPNGEPIARDKDGNDVFLKDLWPTQREIAEVIEKSVQSEQFRNTYNEVYAGDDRWRALPTPEGPLFKWDDDSTYVKLPPYFEGMGLQPPAVDDIDDARCLAKLGDSVTTDHISPAGAIKPDGPAGKYLLEHHVERRQFNSYGSRRGNHEVMMRGTFANVRLRNQLAPGTEGGITQHLPDGEEMSIFDASEKYRAAGIPLIVLAGKEYGSGSSRDWAAKGPSLLGVRAVIAQSFERIHRSNLVGMGVLPLQLASGESAESLGLTGRETYAIHGVAKLFSERKAGKGLPGERTVTVTATDDDGSHKTFTTVVRIDTPEEVKYYEHGGILQYVLRRLAQQDNDEQAAPR